MNFEKLKDAAAFHYDADDTPTRDRLRGEIIRKHHWKHTVIGPGKCNCGHQHDLRDHPLHVAQRIRIEEEETQ